MSSFGELGVTRAQIVTAAPEERGEVILAVPRVDRAARYALTRLGDLVLEEVDVAHLFGKANLEVVELLQNLRVELVADGRGEVAQQRDRVGHEPLSARPAAAHHRSDG